MATTKLKNQAFENVNLGTWTSFTPSWTNLTVGSGGTNTGFYCQIGKTVHFRVSVTLGTSPSVGTVPAFGLPVAIKATGVFAIAHATYVDTGTQTYLGYVDGFGALRVYGVTGSYLTLGSVTSSVPFTWVATDTINIYGTYEAA